MKKGGKKPTKSGKPHGFFTPENRIKWEKILAYIKALHEVLPEGPQVRGKLELGEIEKTVLELWDGFQVHYHKLHPDEKWVKGDRQYLITGGMGTNYYRMRKKRVAKSVWDYVEIDHIVVPDGEPPPE